MGGRSSLCGRGVRGGRNRSQADPLVLYGRRLVLRKGEKRYVTQRYGFLKDGKREMTNGAIVGYRALAAPVCRCRRVLVRRNVMKVRGFHHHERHQGSEEQCCQKAPSAVVSFGKGHSLDKGCREEHLSRAAPAIAGRRSLFGRASGCCFGDKDTLFLSIIQMSSPTTLSGAGDRLRPLRASVAADGGGKAV